MFLTFPGNGIYKNMVPWSFRRLAPDNEHRSSKKTCVVAMGDVAFPGKGDCADDAGENAWAYVQFGEEISIVRERPSFWRDYRKRKWKQLPDGQLVCSDIV